MNFACNSVFDGYRTDMATLQVRSFDDRLYAKLRARAKTNHRSVAKEVVCIVADELNGTARDPAKATDALLALCESWPDRREAAEVIRDIRTSRRKSRPHPVMD